jgi:hypothetical protein
MAQRSELLLLIDEDSHVEDSWQASEVPGRAGAWQPRG